MPRDGFDGAPLRRCRPAMGTYVEVTIRDATPERAAAAFPAAFAAIDRTAALMSFHEPASGLSLLNATAAGRPVRADPWLVAVLVEAAAVFAATDGVFDCAVAPHLVAAGLLPRHRADDPVDRAATFADVVVEDGTVAFRKPLCLDLGGIAKGFAVDRAIDALRACGVRSAIVNAGGDLRVLGPSPVAIHVRGRDGRPAPAGFLADGAFATSRAYAPSRVGPAQSPSALVDPRSGTAVRGDLAYCIVAPMAVHADALTKALAVTGGLSPECLRRFGATALVH